MGIIKLTEKPIGSNPSTNTHFVVTQPETVDGITKESVRRLNRAQVIDDTLSTAGMAADAKAVGDEICVLKADLKAGTEATAEYHLGFYLDENGDLCQVEEE